MSWHDRPYSGSVGGGGWGSGGGGFRENPLAWAPTVGTVFGIRVQVHLIFLLYVAIELVRSATEGGDALWWEFRYMAMLFGLVFLHELGHCFGVRRVGGTADHVLMWPLGGLAYVAPPHRPAAYLVTALSGPLVNVGFAVLSAIVLILGTGSWQAVPVNPFHFTLPPSRVLWSIFEQPWLLWVLQFFYLNYSLAAFNLCMPVYPLDGGQALQAILWYRLGYTRSLRVATAVGMVGAVVFGCYGLFAQNYMLVGIAVFGYITCMQQRRALTEGGYGFVDDLPPAWTTAGGKPRRRSWLEGRWARKQRKLAEQEAEVDRILAKVHDSGLASLTRKEKKILAEATRRQQQDDQRRL